MPLLTFFSLWAQGSRCGESCDRRYRHQYRCICKVSSLEFFETPICYYLGIINLTFSNSKRRQWFLAKPRENAKGDEISSKQREHKPAQNQARRASDRQPRSSTCRRSSTGRRRRRRDNRPGRSGSNLITKDLLRRTTNAHCRRIAIPNTRRNFARRHRRPRHKCHSLRTSTERRTRLVAESHGVSES